ncbi:MAG: site-2 protease family protein [Thermodesulfobacteriota bacterium]
MDEDVGGAGEGRRAEGPKLTLHLVLFALTVLTTVTAGALYEGVNPLVEPLGLVKGIPFSFSLLLILGTHEFGHYAASRLHGVDATLPYFIPAPPVPFMIGTFGAVIKMRSPITTRSALVDIGAAGPLAGFVVAVVVVVVGLGLSEVAPSPPPGEAMNLGSSIMFALLSELAIGPVPEGHDVFLHSVAFAGWIGLFITAMNLFPVGQLDGGHIVYAVIGERHAATVSFVTVACLVALSVFAWQGWFVWALLVMVIGTGHPPVTDEGVPLDGKRRRISAVTLAVFVLTFMPVPFYIS